MDFQSTSANAPQPQLKRTFQEEGGATFLTYELEGIELQGITYSPERTATLARLQTSTAETHLGASAATDVQVFESTETSPAWVSVGIDVAYPSGHRASVDAFVSVQTARELHAKLGEALARHDRPALPTEAEVASVRYGS